MPPPGTPGLPPTTIAVTDTFVPGQELSKINIDLGALQTLITELDSGSKGLGDSQRITVARVLWYLSRLIYFLNEFVGRHRRSEKTILVVMQEALKQQESNLALLGGNPNSSWTLFDYIKEALDQQVKDKPNLVTNPDTEVYNPVRGCHQR